MRFASLCMIVLLLVGSACERPAKECPAKQTMCCPDGEPTCDNSDTEGGEPTQGCVDTTKDRYHCGGCDMECPSNKLDVVSFLPTDCVASVCEPTVGACVSLDMYPNCDLACAVSNQACVAQGCDNTMYVFGSDDLGACNPDTGVPIGLDLACNAAPPPEYFGVGSWVTCCCD